jgi:hypothetical protein
MTKPEVVRCPDGHYRRAIYGLGPYIADYPEQALLACIVQGWCAKSVHLCLIIRTLLRTKPDVLSLSIIQTLKVDAELET